MEISNRIATVTERGLEYDADQRHAEIIVNDLAWRSGDANSEYGGATPGAWAVGPHGPPAGVQRGVCLPGDHVATRLQQPRLGQRCRAQCSRCSIRENLAVRFVFVFLAAAFGAADYLCCKSLQRAFQLHWLVGVSALCVTRGLRGYHLWVRGRSSVSANEYVGRDTGLLHQSHVFGHLVYFEMLDARAC